MDDTSAQVDAALDAMGASDYSPPAPDETDPNVRHEGHDIVIDHAGGSERINAETLDYASQTTNADGSQDSTSLTGGNESMAHSYEDTLGRHIHEVDTNSDGARNESDRTWAPEDTSDLNDL